MLLLRIELAIIIMFNGEKRFQSVYYRMFSQNNQIYFKKITQNSFTSSLKLYTIRTLFTINKRRDTKHEFTRMIR